MARRHAINCLDSLAPDARAAIRDEAEKRVIEKSADRRIGFSTFVAMEERRIALQRHPIPTFEEWERTQH
jgi:hypothetical protein